MKKLKRHGTMTGYLDGVPVFIDEDGYLYKVAEGQQTRVRDSGRYWKATVMNGKWEYEYLPKDAFLDDDWDAISEGGPDYEPGEYE